MAVCLDWTWAVAGVVSNDDGGIDFLCDCICMVSLITCSKMEYSTPFCGFAMFYVKDCLDHLSYCITGIAQHVVKLLPSLNVTVRHQCPRWLSQARHKGFLSTGLTVSGPPHICLMDKCHTFGKPL